MTPAPVRVTETHAPHDATYPTLEAAMAALVARYPEAVFSDIDFDHEPTIWVWPSNAASQHADEREAVAWIRQEISA
ncbi:MAG TPA: hypothetical protein VI542_23210 [Candidatus Tectomicrobia bacterium]